MAKVKKKESYNQAILARLYETLSVLYEIVLGEALCPSRTTAW